MRKYNQKNKNMNNPTGGQAVDSAVISIYI